MPIQIIRNDITKIECDAIVNIANSRLLRPLKKYPIEKMSYYILIFYSCNKEDTRANRSCVMWNYADFEFNYVVMINGTNTGLLIANNVSGESAKECFSRLDIWNAR